jgi:hypothetical protein
MVVIECDAVRPSFGSRVSPGGNRLEPRLVSVFGDGNASKAGLAKESSQAARISLREWQGEFFEERFAAGTEVQCDFGTEALDVPLNSTYSEYQSAVRSQDVHHFLDARRLVLKGHQPKVAEDRIESLVREVQVIYACASPGNGGCLF